MKDWIAALMISNIFACLGHLILNFFPKTKLWHKSQLSLLNIGFDSKADSCSYRWFTVCLMQKRQVPKKTDQAEIQKRGWPRQSQAGNEWSKNSRRKKAEMLSQGNKVNGHREKGAQRLNTLEEER